jgi:hypothetical protein
MSKQATMKIKKNNENKEEFLKRKILKIRKIEKTDLTGERE